MRTVLSMIAMSVLQVTLTLGEEQRAMNDELKLQGTWQLVSGERHGVPFSEETVKNVTLVFKDDVLTTKTKSRSSDAKFRLYPRTDPKGIDLIMDGVPGAGIYLLDGDSLKILHGEVGDARPAEFDTKASPRFTLLVLKRQGR